MPQELLILANVLLGAFLLLVLVAKVVTTPAEKFAKPRGMTVVTWPPGAFLALIVGLAMLVTMLLTSKVSEQEKTLKEKLQGEDHRTR